MPATLRPTASPLWQDTPTQKITNTKTERETKRRAGVTEKGEEWESGGGGGGGGGVIRD